MVTADGYVKVLDFGLAKLRSDGSGGQEQWFDSAAPTWPESPSPQTAVGAVLGTAGYMSPEQARGRPVDYRSDQFALGAILYEMATGRQPFRRETPAQTIAAIIDDTPESLATLAPALPPPLRWLIERCLAKDPAERYASTLDLARELRGLREHLAEVGSTGSSPRRRRPRPLASPPAARRPRRRGRGARRGRVVARAVDARPGRGGPAPAGGPGREAHRRPPVPRAGGEPGGQGPGRGRRRPRSPCASPSSSAFQGSLWVEPSSNVLQAGVDERRPGRARPRGHPGRSPAASSALGGRLLLTAALEDARRDRTLRAVTADGPEDLVEAIVHMLELELGAQEAGRPQRLHHGRRRGRHPRHPGPRLHALRRGPQRPRAVRAVPEPRAGHLPLQSRPRAGPPLRPGPRRPRRGLLAPLPEREEARARAPRASGTASAPWLRTTCSPAPGSRSG